MSINQHFRQNFIKIRENIPPEYERNIILLCRKKKIEVVRAKFA